MAPLWATALVPILGLPLAGVLTQAEAGAALGNQVLLLMMGAFFIAAAMQHCGLHRQFAVMILRATGSDSPHPLIWGLLLISVLMSMWLSNTATQLMLLPLAMPLLAIHADPKVKAMGVLAITYGCNLGGMGTPIGTPPNPVFNSQYEQLTGASYSFAAWMGLAVPILATVAPFMGWWLTRGLRREPARGAQQLRPEPWTQAQKTMLVVFGCTALAWMTRTAPFGGWQSWLGLRGVHDATVALLMAVLLFLLGDGKGGRMLRWKEAKDIHWGVLLLIGGGLTLARGFEASGLSRQLGDALLAVGEMPYWASTGILALSVSFLTEVTTNTATTTLLMPVLASLATSLGQAPELWMLPATLAASCAFMLPSATAPNAIAFSTGDVRIGQMVRAGFAINLAAAAAIAFWSVLLL